MFKLIKKKNSSQKWRLSIQIIFLLLSIWIGVDFWFFNEYIASGGQLAFYSRPPGVDAFLPISALLSVIYFLKTGIVHLAHPAGFFLMCSFLLMSLVFAKSFCSWICVFGTIFEKLADFGEFVFGKKIEMPKIMDRILRSLKYILLTLILYIFLGMSTEALKEFLDSDFNMVCDIRMYDFFVNITFLAFSVFFVISLLSFVFRGFWCRYLCPLGGLMNIMGLLSPNKIHRDVSSCINCSKCSQVCPSFIKVDSLKMVVSDECSSCMQCLDVCPVEDTLTIKPLMFKKAIKKKWFTISIIVIFMGIVSVAMLMGMWQNNISEKDYLRIYIHRAELKHN